MIKKFKLPAVGELGIAVLIIAIISLMILPLPPWLIDGLLALNLTISLALLMITMYIPNIISLSSFPALLLFTTLYRLSLNIASTKSILLHAEAGHIIQSFGELVVGGNLVVGLVVFIIISTVQFIVIAKGSERVAEVGARFTLDAMPGKQMSIDADLRANIITADDARQRRGALAMESKLHGGMDGAMKFVKGDAIAALIITMINIIAGIAVGVMYHGMTSGQAANHFSVLSIGDAMVSQIPSLLISVAAGVIITRVADEVNPQAESLGDEIGRQLSTSSRALYLTSILLIGFALVPGFPWELFLAFAIILSIAGYRLGKRNPSGKKGPTNDNPVPALQRAGSKNAASPILSSPPAFTCAVGVRLSAEIIERLRTNALNAAFEVERNALQEELGLPFPGITLWKAEGMPTNTYEVLLHDVPQAKSMLPEDKVMVPEAHTNSDIQVHCELVHNAGGQEKSYWITKKEASAHTFKTWSIEQVMARHIVGLLRKHASLFIGIQETQWILDQLNLEYPGLVNEVQKVLPLQRISEVFRRLLEEYVPVRNIRNITESLIYWGPKEKDMLLLTEYVRGDLSRFIAHRAANGGRHLKAILLDLEVEQHIRQSIRQTPTGNYLALPPEQANELIQRIGHMAQGHQDSTMALITSMDIRRYVRRLIEPHLGWIPVYSYQELGEHVELQPLGRINL